MRKQIAKGEVRIPKNEAVRTGKIETDTQEIFEKNEFQYLGAGAENIVFEVEGYPNEVAKVHAKTLGELIDINVSRDLAPDEATSEQWNHLKKYVREARARHKELKEYFGDAVLDEQILRRQIPVTRELLEAAEREDTAKKLEPGKTYKLWTAVRMQERLPEAALDDKDSYSFNTNYLERRLSLSDEEYAALNADLLDGAGLLAEEYLKDYPELAKILERMKNEPEIAEAIQEFVKNAIKYTTETGEIIDVAGKSNLRLYKDDEKWKIVLADPMLGQKQTWASATMALGGLANDYAIQPNKLGPALNSLNYARLLNSMAVVTGISDRLRFPHEVGEASVKFLHALEKLPLFSASSEKRRQRRSESTDILDEESEDEIEQDSNITHVF